MNKQELIKQITDKVVENVPDIMELKFGCKIFLSNKQWYIAGIGNNLNGRSFLLSKVNSNMEVISSINQDYLKQSKDKIIGRDITLEDILIAYKKENGIQLTPFGDKIEISVTGIGHTDWQLGKPLHEQTEECLEFICGIIK